MPTERFPETALQKQRHQCRDCASKARKAQRKAQRDTEDKSNAPRKRQARAADAELPRAAAQSQLSGLGGLTHRLVVVEHEKRSVTMTSAEARLPGNVAFLVPPDAPALPVPTNVEELLRNLHTVAQQTNRVPEPYRNALEQAMQRGRRKPVVVRAQPASARADDINDIADDDEHSDDW